LARGWSSLHPIFKEPPCLGQAQRRMKTTLI